MGEKPSQITFRYVCPEDLRDLYVNGIYGGVTPRSEIYLHFYSERHPIPKRATHKIDDKGSVVKEGNMELGGDVVRMVQASVAMDVRTAVAVRDWLNERINFINSQNKK